MLNVSAFDMDLKKSKWHWHIKIKIDNYLRACKKPECLLKFSFCTL